MAARLFGYIGTRARERRDTMRLKHRAANDVYLPAYVVHLDHFHKQIMWTI